MARRHKRRSYARAISGYRRRRRSHRSAAAMNGLTDKLMELALVGAGAAGASFANKFIPGTINPKISAGAKIALGAALPMLVKNPRTKMQLDHLGHGFAAVGVLELLQSFGVLSGIGQVDEVAVSLEGIEDVNYTEVSGAGVDVVNGAGVDVVNGEETILAGEETILAGDDDEGLDF